MSKFWLGVENFVRRKILSVENFVQYFNAKVRQKSDKIVEISAWCRKFCQTKYFVWRKFYPAKFFPVRYMYSYLVKLHTVSQGYSSSLSCRGSAFYLPENSLSNSNKWCINYRWIDRKYGPWKQLLNCRRLSSNNQFWSNGAKHWQKVMKHLLRSLLLPHSYL